MKLSLKFWKFFIFAMLTVVAGCTASAQQKTQGETWRTTSTSTIKMEGLSIPPQPQQTTEVCLPAGPDPLEAMVQQQQMDGDCKTVEKVYLLANPDRSPEHFSIDPKEQLAAVKDMRALGLAPLGNFHSHPSTPARPSAEDIRLAHDPKASYLILSLAEESPVMKAFGVAEGAASPQMLEIMPE